MLALITTAVIYAAVAAGVTFQLVTVLRLAVKAARRHPAFRRKATPVSQPVQLPASPRVRSRIRRRDYRLALRAAKVSVAA